MPSKEYLKRLQQKTYKINEREMLTKEKRKATKDDGCNGKKASKGDNIHNDEGSSAEKKIKTKTLAMTQRDLNNLTKWSYEVTAAHTIRTNDGDLEGTPTQLNFKKSVAFRLIWRHIINVKVHGQNNVQQLLLNISGAAGIGKSFFLNTVKRFATEELGRDGIVRAAAPADTAAYLINEYTLHSILYFPVGTSKC